MKVYSLTIISVFNFFGVKGMHLIRKQSWMNYLLLWTSAGVEPFNNLGEVQDTFFKKKCPFTNCFVTDDRGYFANIQEFDAILFNVLNLNTYDTLPNRRCSNQIYIFVSSKSAKDYPIPRGYDGVFNWTWTYRLDSNILFTYIVVKNKKGVVLGPKIDMRWLPPNLMKVPKNDVISKLQSKTKAIAWIKTDCYTKHETDDVAIALKKELSRYSLTMDTYGECNDADILCSDAKGCEDKLKEDIKKYYFYFALEEAVSEDYVTGKILLALNNYVVPVVYGGANYSRFMPDGTYLNAYDLGLAEVVQQINSSIRDRIKYYSYFKWHRYYTFHSPEQNAYTDNYCGLCTALNDVMRRTQETSYKHIADWWNPLKKKEDLKPIYVPLVNVIRNITVQNDTIIDVNSNNTFVGDNNNNNHQLADNSSTSNIGDKNIVNSTIDYKCINYFNTFTDPNIIDPSVIPFMCKVNKEKNLTPYK